MECEKIRQMVANLTLEEKAALTSGKDNWYTKSIERCGKSNRRRKDGILDRFLPKEKKEQLKQLLIELDSGSRRK